MNPVVFAKPTDRCEPLTSKEIKNVRSAFVEYVSEIIYIDNQGNYRYKNKSGNPLASWNNLMKTLFPDVGDFYRAADRYRETGVFTDPIQTPRINSCSNGKVVEIRIKQPGKYDLGFATIHCDAQHHGLATQMADLVAESLHKFAQEESGRKKIENVLGNLFRKNKSKSKTT